MELHGELPEDQRSTDRRSPGEGQLVGLVLRQMPGVMWVTDTKLKIVAALGRLRRAVVGKTVHEISAGREQEDRLLAAHAHALAGERKSLRIAWGRHWLEVIIEPLRGEDHRVIGCVGFALDVTNRKRADDRIKKNERRLSQSQRLARVGSWEWDIGSNHVSCSDETYRIYGMSRKDFKGDLEGFADRSAILEAMRRPGSFTYNHRIVRPDKSVRMLKTSGITLADERGRPSRMMASVLDITESWETQRALEQNLSLLSATLDSTAEGILVVDLQGRVSLFNQSFLRLWRIPEGLAAHKNDAALMDYVMNQLEAPEEFTRGVRELYDNPELESFDVLRFKDGRVFERYSRPQKISEKAVGRVWSFHDVSDRQQLLTRASFLAEAGRLLQSLDPEKAMNAVAHLATLELADLCVVDVFGMDEPRRLVEVSNAPKAPRPPPIPPSTYQGNPSLETSSGRSMITVPLTVSGRVAGALMLVASKHRVYNRHDLDLVQDLGRRASLALENARLYQDARNALHAREEFLAIVAHEVRGPLSSLRLALGGLDKFMSGGSAQAERFFKIAQREERRIGKFIDDLVEVGVLRSGRFEFELTEVDLAEVVRLVVGRMSPDISRSGSLLQTETDPAVVGVWDRLRLEQTISNLVSNAIKFGQGKPIRIFVHANDGEALLEVRDRGVGIPPGMEAKVFEPFEQAIPQRHFGGLGLGLYIVKRLVQGMGGRIDYARRAGESIFTVRLPRRAF